MGFEIKFNWALQIGLTKDLMEGEIYDFVKGGNRVFPIKTPIDLISSEREAIAKIKIIEFTNTKEATRGKYRVIKIYKGEEKELLTKYWIENE
jgi:hypothetical protein